MHQVVVGSLVLVSEVDVGLGAEGRVVGTEGRSKEMVCCSLLAFFVLVMVGIGEVRC